MLKVVCAVTFPSDVEMVKPVVDKFMQSLEREAEFSSQDKNDLKLIMNELLLNAVIHGNKHDTSKKVKLEAKMDRGVIQATVSDEGGGFNYKEILRQKRDKKGLLEEHGRGIQLAYALSDDMTFNEFGNEISIIKRCQHG